MKVPMTPDGSITWNKHTLLVGDLYIPDETDMAGLPLEFMGYTESFGLRCIGEGYRKEGAAKAYKFRDFAIRVAMAGQVFHSDLSWLQANLMLAEALSLSDEANSGDIKVLTPDYFAMLMGISSMKTLMSYEAKGRAHPRRTGDVVHYEKAKAASEIAHRAFVQRWRERLPMRIDFKPDNVLVGDNSVVLLDADPLAGWGELGI